MGMRGLHGGEAVEVADEITVEDAVQMVTDAIAEYGRPAWLGYVPMRIIKMVPSATLSVLLEENTQAFTKRADKYDALLEWASDHLFEQFTTEQIVEISGFSYPTTLKFLQESPTFRKVKKGLWEVRDADADRKSEKS
jgi:hypothetical protein